MKTYTQAFVYCILAFVSCQPAFGQVVNIRRDPLAIHRDGNDDLTGDWDIGNGRMIQADKIRARNGDGLSLFEDGGLGIFIADGGVMTFDGPVVIPDDWEMRMQTGGSRMVWDSTTDPNTLIIWKTNVGINISPTGKLQVGGGSLVVDSAFGVNAAGNGILLLGDGSNDAVTIRTGTGDDFTIETNAGSERFRITSGGRVGFNETAPAGDIELTNNDPNVIYHDTDETDAADELKGAWHVHAERSGAEEYRASSWETYKEGAADDQKSYVVLKVNDGDDALSPTEAFRLSSVAVATITGTGSPGLSITKTGAETVQLYDDGNFNIIAPSQMWIASGGLHLTGAGNNLTVAGTGVSTFAGDVAVASMIVDTTDPNIVYSASYAIIKKIGVAGSGFPLNFTSVANQTQQNVDFGAIIPAGAIVDQIVLECDETVTGSAVINFVVGTSSGGTQLLASAPVDADGDTSVPGAGTSPVLAHSPTARNVWVGATPAAVDWDQFVAGEWSLIIWIKNGGSVRTQVGL